MASQRMTLTAWSLLIFIAGLWGGAFFLGKIAVSELQPITLVYFRVTIAAITLWVFVVLTKTQFPLSLKWALRFLVLGSINNIVPFTLIFWGQQYIASGLASILNAFTPIFTMLVMQVLTKDEKLTSVKIFAGALGVVGVGILIGQDALAGSGETVLPQLAVLGAALSYAFAGFYIRRFKGIAPASIATGQLTASSLLLLPVIILTVPLESLGQVSVHIWGSVGTLAVFCTALAYLAFFKLYQLAGATNTSMVTFLIPVSAILLGTIFLGERLEANHWAGMAAIVIALLLMDGRLTTRPTRKQQPVS
ncbi:DMT family transporter [Pseudovibrio sp. Tun.PSC04-5.I4]|uniref:DMT family transporter n=1 Tax=Pseudovibrio sp. Tun.PSC04-5.I4 TaxID=1798213 RepID=UPI000886086A|nr:DMT family transporter [Pseudovibrio sp. Tun.PSC04-5.I4]SDR32982.1 Permease of the drug/metabolite transporter (DMT) superfamily [Pseudovibrio sp. Tun.PSC04-5.I4]